MKMKTKNLYIQQQATRFMILVCIKCFLFSLKNNQWCIITRPSKKLTKKSLRYD